MELLKPVTGAAAAVVPPPPLKTKPAAAVKTTVAAAAALPLPLLVLPQQPLLLCSLRTVLGLATALLWALVCVDIYLPTGTMTLVALDGGGDNNGGSSGGVVVGAGVMSASTFGARLHVVSGVYLLLLVVMPWAMHLCLPLYGTRWAMPAARAAAVNAPLLPSQNESPKQTRMTRAVQTAWSTRADWLKAVWPPMALCLLSGACACVCIVAVMRGDPVVLEAFAALATVWRVGLASVVVCAISGIVVVRECGGAVRPVKP